MDPLKNAKLLSLENKVEQLKDSIYAAWGWESFEFMNRMRKWYFDNNDSYCSWERITDFREMPALKAVIEKHPVEFYRNARRVQHMYFMLEEGLYKFFLIWDDVCYETSLPETMEVVFQDLDRLIDEKRELEREIQKQYDAIRNDSEKPKRRRKTRKTNDSDWVCYLWALATVGLVLLNLVLGG